MRAAPVLRARERWVLGIGTAVVVAALLFGRLLPTWRQWVEEERDTARRASLEAERARSAITTLSSTRDSLVARNARYLALAPALLPGPTPGRAGASLASLVSGAAAGAGLRIGAIQIRTDTNRSSPPAVFRRISVRGDAQGDVRGVTQFLAAIEGGPAQLAVRQLSISQPEPAAPPERPEALRLEFVIEGIALDRSAIPRPPPATAADSNEASGHSRPKGPK